MTIANIIKPWAFTNNTETADATKVNADFDTVFSGVNEVINELATAEGSRPTLTNRLSVSMNDDGTLKASALPVGTYDTRTVRVVDDIAGAVTENDSIVMVNANTANRVLTLPLAATAVVCPVIVQLSAAGYSVVVTPHAGDTVMGLETVELAVGGESIKLAPYGTNWYRVG